MKIKKIVEYGIVGAVSSYIIYKYLTGEAKATPPKPSPTPTPKPSPTPPSGTCKTGEYRCVGYDLFYCKGGKWVLQEQDSTQCGYRKPGSIIIMLSPESSTTMLNYKLPIKVWYYIGNHMYKWDKGTYDIYVNGNKVSSSKDSTFYLTFSSAGTYRVYITWNNVKSYPTTITVTSSVPTKMKLVPEYKSPDDTYESITIPQAGSVVLELYGYVNGKWVPWGESFGGYTYSMGNYGGSSDGRSPLITIGPISNPGTYTLNVYSKKYNLKTSITVIVKASPKNEKWILGTGGPITTGKQAFKICIYNLDGTPAPIDDYTITGLPQGTIKIHGNCFCADFRKASYWHHYKIQAHKGDYHSRILTVNVMPGYGITKQGISCVIVGSGGTSVKSYYIVKVYYNGSEWECVMPGKMYTVYVNGKAYTSSSKTEVRIPAPSTFTIKYGGQTCTAKGYNPQPTCKSGERTCSGYDLYHCVNGKWELLERNSSKCGYTLPANEIPLYISINAYYTPDFSSFKHTYIYHTTVNGRHAGMYPTNVDLPNVKPIGMYTIDTLLFNVSDRYNASNYSPPPFSAQLYATPDGFVAIKAPESGVKWWISAYPVLADIYVSDGNTSKKVNWSPPIDIIHLMSTNIRINEANKDVTVYAKYNTKVLVKATVSLSRAMAEGSVTIIPELNGEWKERVYWK